MGTQKVLKLRARDDRDVTRLPHPSRQPLSAR